MKNTLIILLSISLTFIRPEISANYFLSGRSIRRISLDIALVNFLSQVLVIVHFAKKSEREIYRVLLL